MAGRDKSDYNQKDQCSKNQSQKNPKLDLQFIQDKEKAKDARAWFNEQHKLIKTMLIKK